MWENGGGRKGWENAGVFPALFAPSGNKEARNGLAEPRFDQIGGGNGLLGKLLHGGNQADVRAAGGALGGGHFHGGVGSGAAAVIARAEETGAGSATDAGLLGHGSVARDSFLDRLGHAALAALGAAGGVNHLGDDVVLAGFDLAGFRAVAGGVVADSEHRATGREAERNDGQ